MYKPYLFWVANGNTRLEAQEGNYADKYAFIGEWYDVQASLLLRYNIFYFPFDDTLLIYDLRRRKPLMRRMKVDGVTLIDFYIGASIVILGRKMNIVGFACKDTEFRLKKDMEVLFAIIKPMDLGTVGKIIEHIQKGGLRVTKMKMVILDAETIEEVFGSQAKLASFPFHLEHLKGQRVIGIELVGKNSVEVAHKLTGASDSTKAEPGTIRALYGYDAVRNCLFLSRTTESSQKNIELIFDRSIPLTATLTNCTLCVIKPHAIREGKLGAILTAIDEGGFEATALNMFLVDKVNAVEFYEVYKGINVEYQGMVDDLASGPCVAMEIIAKDKTLTSAIEFRKLVGPCDPEIARMLRPNTLRAKFGETKVRNAIHCSDLYEDGLLEVEYFFKIL